MKRAALAVLVSVVASPAAASPEACGGTAVGHRLIVLEEEAACPWPFTVDAAIIQCRSLGGRAAEVWIETDVGTYGLNGFGVQRYGELEPIWLEDDRFGSGTGLRVNVGPWIDVGLALCQG